MRIPEQRDQYNLPKRTYCTLNPDNPEFPDMGDLDDATFRQMWVDTGDGQPVPLQDVLEIWGRSDDEDQQ